MRSPVPQVVAVHGILLVLSVTLSWRHVIAADVDLIDADARDAIRSDVSLDYHEALWPDSNDVVGAPVPIETIDPRVVGDAVEGVRALIRDELVPADLTQRFRPLRVTLVPGHPYLVDAFLARYEAAGWDIQLRERGTFLSIVCRPVVAISESNPEKYILDVARTVLRLPKGASDQMKVSNVSIGGGPIPGVPEGQLRSVRTRQGRTIWYGLLRCKPYEGAHYSLSPDRPKDAWAGQIWTMTDGCWVYLGARETHKPPGRPRATPGAILRFPVARRPVSEPTTTRRGVRPPVNLPLEAGLVLPSTAPSE